MENSDLPTARDIIDVHSRIERIYDLKYEGLRSRTPTRTLREKALDPVREYDDVYHRAAALLFGIQSAHVFEDANKRTSWAVTITYLRENDCSPSFEQDGELVEGIIRSIGYFDTETVANWLETGEMDVSELPERLR
ncbi:Fic family protein [Halococcus salsus]|uniref:Fic family protein n=1 Tax=Halococcus salsus TaxID=2162894 RepID=UPI00135BF056|nr:Fic family protein [Halococcus salsus]